VKILRFFGLWLSLGFAAMPAIAATPSGPAGLVPAPRGIVLLLKMDQPIATNKNNSWVISQPWLDGVYIHDEWANVEPSKGVFDWSYLDAQINEAAKAGKWVSIAVAAGMFSPDWVYADGVTKFDTKQAQLKKAKACNPITIPVPWTGSYIDDFDTMVAAFGARYANNPAVRLVKITGVNEDTDETKLPRSESESSATCQLPNDVAHWQALGYTGAKALQTFETIANAFGRAFPHQWLGVMTAEHSFPALSLDGKLDPDGIALGTAYMLPYAFKAFPGRFIAAQNGLRPNHIDPGILSYVAATGGPFGWQPSWGTALVCAGGKDAPCALNDYLTQLFANGIKRQSGPNGAQIKPTYNEYMNVQLMAQGVGPQLQAIHENLTKP
jgi:hypothetical protein